MLLVACLSAKSTLAEATPSTSGTDRSVSIWQDVQWTDLAGRKWTAEQLEGRIVLLDFWATWCAPCLAELPHLRALHQRFSHDKLVILGIALDSIDRRRLRAFLSRHDVRWPQLHEPQGTSAPLARRFSIEAVPVTLLVDGEGRVVARDLRGRALSAAIEALVRLAG